MYLNSVERGCVKIRADQTFYRSFRILSGKKKVRIEKTGEGFNKMHLFDYSDTVV